MDDIFQFHKELNFKKILLFILIIIIISITLFFVFRKPKIKEEIPVTFTDANQTISISLSPKYNLMAEKSKRGNLIELYSKNNLNISLSKTNKLFGKELLDIILADRSIYTSNYKNIADLSEISTINTNYIEAYTYSFKLKENSLTNIFQTIWINSDDCYYILDIKYPEIDKDLYVNLVKELIASFTLK